MALAGELYVSGAPGPGKPVSRKEIWEFYRKAGFFNSTRMQTLSRSLNSAEETWDKLLASGDEIAWTIYERIEGEMRSSCVVYRHTLPTRLVQHWVSLRNPVGNMKTIIDTVTRVRDDATSRFIRTFYRPNNPLGVRLFRSLYELVPGEAAAHQLYEVLRIGTSGASSSLLPAMTPQEFEIIAPRLLEKMGRIDWEAEGLVGDDPFCRKLGEVYHRAGLARERAFFALYHDGDRTNTDKLIAVVMADYSSYGLSLSGFNNMARLIILRPIESPEQWEALIGSLRRFYSDRGLDEFCLFSDSATAARFATDPQQRNGACQIATFDMNGEYSGIIIRHIRAFNEARVGLARIVTDLSEEELDWINENGQRMAYQSGETVIQEGEMADSLFLIQSGEVGIFHGLGRDRVQVAICRAPDVVGEIGVLHCVRRTASVVALTPLIALRVSNEKLRQFFKIFPEGGRSLNEALVQRIEQDVRVQGITSKWDMELVS